MILPPSTTIKIFDIRGDFYIRRQDLLRRHHDRSSHDHMDGRHGFRLYHRSRQHAHCHSHGNRPCIRFGAGEGRGHRPGRRRSRALRGSCPYGHRRTRRTRHVHPHEAAIDDNRRDVVLGQLDLILGPVTIWGVGEGTINAVFWIRLVAHHVAVRDRREVAKHVLAAVVRDDEPEPA